MFHKSQRTLHFAGQYVYARTVASDASFSARDGSQVGRSRTSDKLESSRM